MPLELAETCVVGSAHPTFSIILNSQFSILNSQLLPCLYMNFAVTTAASLMNGAR